MARGRPARLRRPPRTQPYSGDGCREVSGVTEKAPEVAPPSVEERGLAASSEHEPRDRSEIGQLRAVVPRWVQLVLLPLALLAVWAVAKASGKVLVIFIVAALIALILNPAVALLQRARLPRGLAVLVIFIVAALIALILNPDRKSTR